MKPGKIGTAAMIAALFAAPAYAQHQRGETRSAQPVAQPVAQAPYPVQQMPMQQPMSPYPMQAVQRYPMPMQPPLDDNVQRVLLGNGHIRGPTVGIPAGLSQTQPVRMPPNPALGHAVPRRVFPGTNISTRQNVSVTSISVGFGFGGFGSFYPLALPFSGGIYYSNFGMPYFWYPVPSAIYGGYYLSSIAANRPYYPGDSRDYEEMQRKYEQRINELEQKLNSLSGSGGGKIDEAYRRGREGEKREILESISAPAPEVRTPAVSEERLAVRELAESTTFEDGYKVICKVQYDDEARIYLNAVAKAAGRSDLGAYNTKENEVAYRNKSKDYALVMKMTLPSARTMKEDDFIAYFNKQLIESGLIHPSAIKNVQRIMSSYVCRADIQGFNR